jgi:hypothetical protein
VRKEARRSSTATYKEGATILNAGVGLKLGALPVLGIILVQRSVFQGLGSDNQAQKSLVRPNSKVLWVFLIWRQSPNQPPWHRAASAPRRAPSFRRSLSLAVLLVTQACQEVDARLRQDRRVL